MSKLVWDATGERFYETGVESVALYKMTNSGYGTGVAWNGVTAINETPSGGESNEQYADDILYLNLISQEKFGFTIEAFQAPKEFNECDGSVEIAPGVYAGQQARKSFGLAYKSKIGNDVDNDEHGYYLHLVYGAKASPTEVRRSTINETPEPSTLSWECNTTPEKIEGYRPIAHIKIDSRDFKSTADKTKLANFEKTLFGDTATDPTLPPISTVISTFQPSGQTS